MKNLFCEVTSEEIDPTEVIEFVNHFSHGAQVLFMGSVRKNNAGREVVAVEYDAAISLARQELIRISEEAILNWGPSLRVYLIHRIGKLEIGDISVAIGVSSPHRDESYQASRYLIEQIKVRVPIWKKEFYSDGETEWLKGHALCQHS